MADARGVALEVNGAAVTCAAPAGRMLTEFLRDDLGLTGTKMACGVGVCGLCTVLVDGALTSACLLPIVCAEGQAVWTIEGVSRRPSAGGEPQVGDASAGAREVAGDASPEPRTMVPKAHRLEDAFLACGATQCGICTPGQMMSALGLLREDGSPSDQAIRHHMSGNLCRCTGYAAILRAIRHASDEPQASHAP